MKKGQSINNELNDFLEANNLKLLSEISEPKWKDKIELECLNCGTKFAISIQQLLRPHPIRTTPVCPLCNSKDKFNKALIRKYGRIPYEFLSEFKGYSESIKVKCLDCGFEFESTPEVLLMNVHLDKGCHPCTNCTKLRLRAKKDIKELERTLKAKFGECNYEFPHPELYAGMHSKEKFEIICKKCGHTMHTYINNILNPKNGYHYCRVCNSKDRLLETMSYKERCLKVTGGKIEPIDDYIDSKTPIRHKCNVCGYGIDEDWYKIPVKNTTLNAGCPRCSKIIATSKAENEIYDYIKSIYSGEIIKKDRSVLGSSKELDIYIPDLKIAIEIDGLYWHSDVYKDKKYHINKTNECAEKGIRLIHIFDDEWYQRQEIVKTKLLTILGKNNSTNLYARKCTPIDISSKDKNEFLNKYHIQGGDNASVSKALEYNGEIVAVMTFCKPRRCLGSVGSSDGDYELSRFATKYHIVGAFSKLFKTILNENPEIKNIKTFADLRWSSLTSNVYEKNGFTLDHVSAPNYFYFDSSASAQNARRIHRFSFRKQTLKEKFPEVYDDKLTEFQIMDKTTYRRIWDCGNAVYIYKRK